MRNSAFTILEIMIVVIVVGIIVTFSVPLYQGTVENAKAKVCAANLDALQTALDIYAMDHDVMPADLSELPEDTLRKAYAQVLEKKDAWKLKLALFIVGWQQRGLAYAVPFIDGLAGGRINAFTCPSAAPGTRSYGVNSVLAGKTVQQYLALSGINVFIGDSGSTTFSSESDLIKRHKHQHIISSSNYAQATMQNVGAVMVGGDSDDVGCLAALKECVLQCDREPTIREKQDCRRPCKATYRRCIGKTNADTD